MKKGSIVEQDIQLLHAVPDEFGRDAGIDPSHIDVTARAAARAAERVKEVTAVVQDLEVNTRGGEESTDDGLATRALSALAADPAIPDDRLSLTIEDGWITVAGEVDWEYQKVAAADDIHRVAGIRGVTNDIVITVHDVVGG